jgi:hypothetical protein
MHPRNTSLIILTVAAWMCRALVPPGFMPQTGDHFSVALKICPGHALHSQLGEPTQGKLPQPRQLPAGSDLPCVFSAGMASVPPSAIVATLPHIDTLHLAVISFRAADTGRLSARAQSARGPPLLI